MLYEANVNENQVYLNSSVYANDKDITDIVFEYGSLEFNNTLNITPNYVNGQASNYLSSILQTNSLDANKAYKVRLKGFTNGKTVYSNTILFNSNKSLILIEDKTEVLSSTSIKLSGLIKSYDYYPVTDISFEYGTSPDLGTVIQAAPNYSYNLSTFPVSQIISELNLGQKYYYKISAVQNGIKKYSDLYEFIMNPLATTENFENNTILIYPNPVKNQLFLDAKTKITKIEVYDLTGKLIMKKLQENIKSINIEDLSVATYILKIYTKDKTISKKIIKQ